MDTNPKQLLYTEKAFFLQKGASNGFTIERTANKGDWNWREVRSAILVFINGSGAVYQVDGKIGRLSAENDESQLDYMFEEFYKYNISEPSMMFVTYQAL